MPLKLTVTGADFSAANVGRVIKLTTDRTALVGEYMFGRNRNTSLINGVDGGVVPVVNVDPTYGTHKLTTDATTSKYVDTLVSDAADVTALIIVAFPAGSYINKTIVGQGISHKWNFYAGGSGGFTLQALANDATNQQATFAGAPTSPLTDFRAMACRISGLTDYVMKVDEFKGGARMGGATTTATGKTRSIDPALLALGSLRSTGTFSTSLDIAGGLIWQRTLTDAELLAAYVEARASFGSVGIAC